MKKIILLLSCLSMLLFTPKVDAKYLNYIDYRSLELQHAFIVGDYIFDLSEGYSPNLQDFMIASRTIPNTMPVYVQEITIVDIPEIDFHAFSTFEIYTKEYSDSSTDYKEMNAKYVYKSNIDGADEDDYEVIS